MSFLIKDYNELGKYLLERGYSDKMVRKEILRARAIPRDALLEKVNDQEKQNKITFNITYHPVFGDARKILEELHVILASDDGHKKVFLKVPMIGFKINKHLKAHLVSDCNWIRTHNHLVHKRTLNHLAKLAK